jgi:hypothetical protein
MAAAADIPLSGGSLVEKKQSGNAPRIAIDEIPFALDAHTARGHA